MVERDLSRESDRRDHARPSVNLAPRTQPNVAPRGNPERPPVPAGRYERLEMIRGWLLAGKPPGDVRLVVQTLFGVGERMAYKYIAHARAGMTQEALEEGRFYQLRRTQLLRDRLVDRTIRALDADQLDPGTLRAVAGAVSVLNRTLDSRDQSTRDFFDDLLRDPNGVRAEMKDASELEVCEASPAHVRLLPQTADEPKEDDNDDSVDEDLDDLNDLGKGSSVEGMPQWQCTRTEDIEIAAVISAASP